MSEMVKRVAEVIGCQHGDLCQGRHVPSRCDDCMDVARDAISAMREPTDAIEAVSAMSISYSPAEIWRAMIDGALK